MAVFCINTFSNVIHSCDGIAERLAAITPVCILQCDMNLQKSIWNANVKNI